MLAIMHVWLEGIGASLTSAWFVDPSHGGFLNRAIAFPLSARYDFPLVTSRLASSSGGTWLLARGFVVKAKPPPAPRQNRESQALSACQRVVGDVNRGQQRAWAFNTDNDIGAVMIQCLRGAARGVMSSTSAGSGRATVTACAFIRAVALFARVGRLTSRAAPETLGANLW
jgi:hypothetical protein